MTLSAFHKLCALVKCNQQEVSSQQELSQDIAQLDMQTPFVPYKRGDILEEIPESSSLSKDESNIDSSVNERIIEPLPEAQSQDASCLVDEQIPCEDNVDQ